MKIQSIFLSVIAVLFTCGWTAPLNAAELPYKQMALQSLHCKSIPNKRRKKNCARNATAPIHSKCQALRGLSQKSCFRIHAKNLRMAMENELKKRRKK